VLLCDAFIGFIACNEEEKSEESVALSRFESEQPVFYPKVLRRTTKRAKPESSALTKTK